MDDNKEYKHQDRYYHQKQYQKKNQKRINSWRVVYNHKKKYGEFLDTEDKVKEFKKNKSLYLKLNKLDRDLALHFLINK